MSGRLSSSAGTTRWETHDCDPFHLLAMTKGLPGTGDLPSHPHRRPRSAGLALFCTAPAWSRDEKKKKSEKTKKSIEQCR